MQNQSKYDVVLQEKLANKNGAVKKTITEDINNWVDTQIARFDELLRENFSKGIEEFTHYIFVYLCELTQASRGVFFIRQERADYLKAITGYACPKEILKNTIFEIGEGLVGQAASSQKELYFDGLTDYYCHQEFASLRVNVSSILFLPLVFNNRVYGVLELAYLNNLENKFLLFLKKASKNIAIMMESILNHLTTQGLLAVTQKQKELLNEREEELEQNLEEVTAMHSVLQKQNQKVEEAFNKLEKSNAHILESIRYAKRIQEAILPSNTKLNTAFANHFLIYRPKDIVSGDFYWYLQVKNKKILGVIDCTGHGVPGAFMSMIAHTLLNQIVMENKIYKPSQILALLDQKVKETIRHDASKSKDGMDLMICCIESDRKGKIRLAFAGAKSNLYYTKEKQLHIIKGNRKSIGEYTIQNHIEFSNHVIYLKKGDTLYLTTDGLFDICNSKRISFGKKRWEDLINQIINKSFVNQKNIIEQEVDAYQQNADQRDDITLLAVRL
jgi:serine phosphatase RsbU (regulator of sigma subunit)